MEYQFPIYITLRAQEYFLGRGGIFGLLPALVGESLPGARAVVAEGNLLRRGPVIFRVPPVRRRSLHGALGCHCRRSLRVSIYDCIIPMARNDGLLRMRFSISA